MEHTRYEVRSSEVQQVLQKKPAKLLVWGNVLIIVIMMSVLCLLLTIHIIKEQTVNVKVVGNEDSLQLYTPINAAVAKKIAVVSLDDTIPVKSFTTFLYKEGTLLGITVKLKNEITTEHMQLRYRQQEGTLMEALFSSSEKALH